jgi:serine/threonine-protein kinase HipA
LGELLSLNGSSAGARPKVMVGVSKNKNEIIHGVDDVPIGYDHWLIKFTSSTDPEDNGVIEYAYSLMAKSVGIYMPETYLFPALKGAGYFGVQRFDRKGNDKIHIHTVSGLLHADHRLPALDYEDILKTAMVLTKSMPEVEAVFRLAVFNILTHNRDDHSKNFAFLMESDGAWTAAPAYDLTFSSGPAGEHSTTVMGEGKSPSRKHLQQLGKKMGIKKTDDIIDQVVAAVSRWKEFADEAGVKKSSRDLINKTIQL